MADAHATAHQPSDASADTLAAQAGVDPKHRRQPTRGWTTHATWYEDSSRLLAVVGAEKERAADLALAHGLALRGGKKLGLVLPDGWVEPTRRRLPWLQVPIEFWRHDNATIQTVQAAAPGEHPYPADDEHPALHLGDRTDWVGALMDWAGRHDNLDPGHRGNVRAWHCRGTRVLKIERTRSGLRITAGIAYKDPGQPGESVSREITAPLTQHAQAETQDRVESGVAARLQGAAGGHNEHWLQAVLRRRPDLLDLEQPVLREVPAWRPLRDPDGSNLNGYGRGFLDLVGLDPRGDLHLVETKLASDHMLVLQGVDYLAWASQAEHRNRLAVRLGCQPSVPVVLHFVIGADSSGTAAIGRYAKAQAEALRDDLRWQFSIVTDWQAGHPKVTHLPPGETPTD